MTPRLDGIRIVRLGAAAAVFVAGAVIAHWSRPTTFEIDVFRLVNDRSGVFRIPGETIMQLGTSFAVVLVGVVALAARRPRIALCAILSGLTGALAAHFLRDLVGRDRPLDLLHDVIVRGPRITGVGYPSGHTTTAAALVAGVAPYLPRWARRVAWTGVVLVALARVYVGAHLPLDVIGGLALGTVIGAMVNLALPVTSPRRATGQGGSK